VTLLLVGLLLILAGGLGAAALRRRPAMADSAFGVLVASGCVLGAVPAIRVLAGGSAPSLSLAVPVPGGPWAFGIDGLSAFFVLIVLGVGLASAARVRLPALTLSPPLCSPPWRLS
jgi:formate hydrogenlyase subunit 3/multisubunit Na+/H+ antiporter MnhD subunit